MIRAIRALIALFAICVVASCGGGDSSKSSKLKTYSGPPVTQVVVKKGDRKLYLISGKSVVKTYEIKLGQQPVGDKKYEGDGKTPEGVYFIDRFNPNSRYYLSVGISYPSAQDVAQAAALGLRPGGDIFIHGQPNGRPGPPIARDWTDGCIAVTNDEIKQLWDRVPDGTPITIRP